MKSTILFFVGMVFLVSCDRERLNTKEFAKELKEKKIKRVTPGEISASAMKLGKTIDDTITKLMVSKNCDLKSMAVVKTFKEDFDSQVYFYTTKDTSTMDAITKQVFQSTEYGQANAVPEASKPNLQNLRNGYWLYSRPLAKTECNTASFSMLSIVMSQVEIIKKLN
jgi:hypothetical protein